ncbi:hypothetical protein K2173_004012 [Erythroxylum novogranatense]|uniref:DDE Tnp4 domain-containing protein n=1 Tax=Erythroxylum novogranatense TaxID=1862640 RepID=A0AAV8SJB9_9ROSI|nr:hypothetical protein K2173_004012 [Erythroxylum novogranatense]
MRRKTSIERNQCISTFSLLHMFLLYTYNLNFVYVLVGWEGSAADSRVLHDAVRNYYLVDTGYTNGPGFLAPFRGTRYHIQEWARDGRAPRNAEELFNKRHASARNVIERAFGLLKKRWKILRNPSFYPASTHVLIIIACCLLHNFIRLHMSSDPAEFADMEPEEMPIGEDVPLPEFFDRVETNNEWTQWRAELANNMFDEWRSHH